MTHDPINAALFEIQRGVSESSGGGKFDIHYTAGKGALIVPHGTELTPDNVVLAVPDAHVQMYAAMAEFARGGVA
ncbi:hypothetical protein [Paenibacillus graminis]|uniref:hypothetical protein n=1 Tax=Paenibacillus graminis TaxID=189425 RepID=UPI002DBD5A92|nr:hypothetical protein [Paenibacillus graminis]MEC0167920.1 hypothetical protein [Paenibacillus graminis]